MKLSPLTLQTRTYKNMLMCEVKVKEFTVAEGSGDWVVGSGRDSVFH